MNQTHPSIEQLVEYLHGELPAADDAAVHAHLAQCSACDERRAEELALVETLRAHARAVEREMPAGLAARIRAATAVPQPTPWQRLRDGLRPVWMIPAAAAAAVAIYAGFSLHHATLTPTVIDAAAYVDQHAALATVAPFTDAAPSATLTSDDATP
jgi:anti-sigma factor RsiW